MPATLFLTLALGAQSIPPGLKCLERYYGIEPIQQSGQWTAKVPSGQTLVYDDGKVKTLDEKITNADLEDMYAIRYKAGPIEPITNPEENPGRIRAEAFFEAVYGDSANKVKSQLEKVAVYKTPFPIHRRIKAAIEKVLTRLHPLLQQPLFQKFFKNMAGTFNWRTIAGTDMRSTHSYGIAIDLRADLGDYWRWTPEFKKGLFDDGAARVWKNRVPLEIVQAFEAEGFIWGGRWYLFDTMHFEYRPELLDDSCYGTQTEPRPGN